MRTLTSVQSSTNILTDLEFHLLAADQSTTWIFDRNDILNLSGLNWEVPFGGGFGNPSNYNITLNTSMGFISSQIDNIVKGETFLKVYVNSDNFTPHVGRVRSLDRRAENPNLLTLGIYDRFLDNNPLFPVEALVDSYNTLHPEVSNVDMGYPVYYGRHIRPFYMTPVDCSIQSLLGPRNISSENHVTSLWYYTGVTSLLLLSGGWDQQSGSTNIASHDLPFEVADLNTLASTIFGFKDIIAVPDVTSFFYEGAILEKQGSYIKTHPYRYSAGTTVLNIRCEAKLNTIKNSTKIFFSVVHSNITNADSLFSNTTFVAVTSSDTFENLNLLQITSDTAVGSASLVGSLDDFLVGDVDHKLQTNVSASSVSPVGKITSAASINVYVQLISEAYKNYSISGRQVNSATVAISENGIHILTDVYSQAGVNFVAAQASQSQFDTRSYDFQCYFDVRRSVKDITDEFGKITNTYVWMGDSGFANFKTYQESHVLQNSDLINFTITTSDILRNSLTIKDDPLGISTYQTKKAKKVAFEYNYDFRTGKYDRIEVLDPSNNAFCESAEAAGIAGEFRSQTQCMVNTRSARVHAFSLVRQLTQSQNVIEVNLPARFFEAEISDVCKVQHPAIIGSESLYQITAITPDYIGGEVRCKLYEILNLFDEL
jgi:hypothetical protein